jgi:hypothetical protein
MWNLKVIAEVRELENILERATGWCLVTAWSRKNGFQNWSVVYGWLVKMPLTQRTNSRHNGPMISSPFLFAPVALCRCVLRAWRVATCPEPGVNLSD